MPWQMGWLRRHAWNIIRKGHIEGTPESGWIIVDYGDIVVHIFDPDLRQYYKLEELWDEGKVLLRVQ